ncbi:hypothetical protein BH10CYA1_BH10CYA1_07110 [soil metagenome]
MAPIGYLNQTVELLIEVTKTDTAIGAFEDPDDQPIQLRFYSLLLRQCQGKQMSAHHFAALGPKPPPAKLK